MTAQYSRPAPVALVRTVWAETDGGKGALLIELDATRQHNAPSTSGFCRFSRGCLKLHQMGRELSCTRFWAHSRTGRVSSPS
jgi:hypothetical protein